MSPSADPVVKNSSAGSMDMLLMAESWAWNVCRSWRWRVSKMLMSPFLPPLMSSWCLAEYSRAELPSRWHWKPAGEDLISHKMSYIRWGKNQADPWRIPRPVNKVLKAWRANEHHVTHLQAKTVPMNSIWSESVQWLWSYSVCKVLSGQTDGWTHKWNNRRGQFQVLLFPLERAEDEKYKNAVLPVYKIPLWR